jgi:hypothetical protein
VGTAIDGIATIRLTERRQTLHHEGTKVRRTREFF